jgi:hypothetical protein
MSPGILSGGDVAARDIATCCLVVFIVIGTCSPAVLTGLRHCSRDCQVFVAAVPGLQLQNAAVRLLRHVRRVSNPDLSFQNLCFLGLKTIWLFCGGFFMSAFANLLISPLIHYVLSRDRGRLNLMSEKHSVLEVRL